MTTPASEWVCEAIAGHFSFGPMRCFAPGFYLVTCEDDYCDPERQHDHVVCQEHHPTAQNAQEER